MPRGIRIRWDAPASEAVDGAPKDISLRDWLVRRREAGETVEALAAEINVGKQTIMRNARLPADSPRLRRPKPAASAPETPADNIGAEVTPAPRANEEAPPANEEPNSPPGQPMPKLKPKPTPAPEPEPDALRDEPPMIRPEELPDVIARAYLQVIGAEAAFLTFRDGWLACEQREE